MQKSVSTTSPRTLLQIAEKFPLIVQKRFKISFYREKISSLWTGRLLFWRSLLKMLNDKLVCFSSLSGNERKIMKCFSKLLSSNRSYGQVECNFNNPYKNILQEERENLTHFPKKIGNSICFKTLNFSPTCSSAHVECNFDNHWKRFANRPEN